MGRYKLKYADDEVFAFRFGYEEEPKWLEKFKSRYEYECFENKKPYLYKGNMIAKIKNKFGYEIVEKGDWIFLDSGEIETFCDIVFNTYFEKVE